MSRTENITCDVCNKDVTRVSYADARVYGADICLVCVIPALPALRALGIDDIYLRHAGDLEAPEKLIHSQWAKDTIKEIGDRAMTEGSHVIR